MSESRRTTQKSRSLAWAMADQAISSATNFGVGLIAARLLGPTAFGAYSVAFVLYLLTLGVSRALTSDPLAIRFAAADPKQRRLAAADGAGVVFYFAVAVSVLAMATALLVGDNLRPGLFALAVSLPGLLLQDYWRYFFFVTSRGAYALANDLTWGFLLALALAVLAKTERLTVGWIVLAWGGSATLAAFVGMLQSHIVPKLANPFEWLRRNGDLGWRYVGEFVTWSGGTQLAVLALSVVSGTAVVGTLRSGQLLLGPINVGLMGASMAALPESARLARESIRRLTVFLMALSIVLMVTSVLWGFAIQVLSPRFGTALLGDSWPGAHSVALTLALGMAATGAATGAGIGLRGMAAAKSSLRLRIWFAPLLVMGPVVGGWLGGAEGASLGIAIVGWFCVPFWWRAYREQASQMDVANRRPALVPTFAGNTQ